MCEWLQKIRLHSICCIAGLFLYVDTYVDELLFMTLDEVCIAAKIISNPKFTNFVLKLPDGRKLIYVELPKAIYICMKSSHYLF